jgi:hypothetical protein
MALTVMAGLVPGLVPAIHVVQPHRSLKYRLPIGQGEAQQLMNRRHPLGSTRHRERSEAIHGSAAARPPVGATPRPLAHQVLERLLHNRFWELVGGPSRGEMDCFATLAMTGSARGKGNSWGSRPRLLVFETDFRKKRLNQRNSLHFSLRPGNLARQEIVELIQGEPPRSRCGMLASRASFAYEINS